MDYLEPFRKYATFSGRASRREYWMFVLLFQFTAGILLAIITGITGAGFLFLLYLLFIILPSLSVTVRRLHDTGKSAVWLLITFIPFGQLVLLFFLLQAGSGTRNQYDVEGSLENQVAVNVATNGADLGLINYIKNAQASGKTEVEIRAILTANSWSEAQITQALDSLKGHIVTETVSKEPVTRPTSPEDESTAMLVRTIIILLIVILAGLFWFRYVKNDSSTEVQVSVLDTEIGRSEKTELVPVTFEPKTIHGVDAEFSIRIPEKNDELCKYMKEGSRAIGTKGREYTICVKTTTRCDKISDLDFDVSEERDRVLFKYNHTPVEQCESPELRSVHLVYTLSNLKEGGVSSETVVNKPDQKIAVAEYAINNDDTQLDRDAGLTCGFFAAWGASSVYKNDSKKGEFEAYTNEYNKILKKYNLTDETFPAEWKKVELRLESNLEYKKEVMDIVEKSCVK